jgi:hypothetical protein
MVRKIQFGIVNEQRKKGSNFKVSKKEGKKERKKEGFIYF